MNASHRAIAALPPTLQAHSTEQTCAFRHGVVAAAGDGDWSQIATLLVK